MLPVGIPKERAFNLPTGSTKLAKLRALVADDAFAATFQTMGQYRTALLHAASILSRSSSNFEVSGANLEGLAKALLAPRAIVRDAQGWLDHPSLPICDEGVPFDQLLGAFGLETYFRGMEGDAPQEVEDRYFEQGESGCAEWTPTPPDGDGWHLLSIYETEDGPFAMFARGMPPQLKQSRLQAFQQSTDATTNESRNSKSSAQSPI